jgi:uncharacterized protein
MPALRYAVCSIGSVVWLCLLFIATKSYAQNTLLWKFSTPGGATHHIYGTIHLADTSLVHVHPNMMPAFASSSRFFAELDMDKMMAGINPMMLLIPNGGHLSKFYTREQFALIDSAIQSIFGPSASAIVRMRPAVVAAMMMINQANEEHSKMSGNQHDGSSALDMHLWDLAKESGKECRGLETTNEQIEAFGSMPDSLLYVIVRDSKKQADQTTSLLTMYREQNLTEIEKLINSDESFKDFMVVLNDNRNKVLAERIAQQTKGTSMFIGIGAAHLPGPKGVIALLRNKGISVQPVMP